jgi:hypothetical protein
MKTIIKINFSNYSENEIILDLNSVASLKEAMSKDSDFISFEIIQEGDDIELVKTMLFNSEEAQEKLIENVKMIHADGQTFLIDVVVRADGKIKLLFDTFGNDWRQSFQTIKETGKGYFVNLYRARVYFDFDFPKF